jgi:hypothetical protein
LQVGGQRLLDDLLGAGQKLLLTHPLQQLGQRLGQLDTDVLPVLIEMGEAA